MTVTNFSYEPSQLPTSELYQVRFEIGDTDEDEALFDDYEILYAISVERNMWGAAARCAETLALQFGRQADVSLGRNLKIEYTKRAAAFTALAKQLRAKNLGTVLPYAGGRAVAEKLDAAADTGAVQPLFTKKGATNPRIGGTSADPLGV